jgi:hypothetical protein
MGSYKFALAPLFGLCLFRAPIVSAQTTKPHELAPTSPQYNPFEDVPTILLESATSGTAGWPRLTIRLMTDRKQAGDYGTDGGESRFRIGSLSTNGDDRFTSLLRCIYDTSKHAYFGYELLFERQQSGDYLVFAGKLELSQFEVFTDILRQPEKARPPGFPITWADLNYEPLPGYPPPQTVQAGGTLTIDLLTDPDTGRKLVDNILLTPGPPTAAARPAALRLPGGTRNSPQIPTVPGSPRDFSAADAELQIIQPRVTLNGTLQAPISPRLGDARGPLIWIYLPGHGRYVLSLGSHTDLDFRKAGEVRGGAIIFTLGDDSIKLECTNPVATGDAPYNLYVIHEPEWEPTAQAQKSQLAVGTVGAGELAGPERK